MTAPRVENRSPRTPRRSHAVQHQIEQKESEAVEAMLFSFTGGSDSEQLSTTRRRLKEYLRMAISEGRALEREAQQLGAEEVAKSRSRRAVWGRYVLVIAMAVWSALMIPAAMEQRGDLMSKIFAWGILSALPIIAVSALAAGLRWARGQPILPE